MKLKKTIRGCLSNISTQRLFTANCFISVLRSSTAVRTTGEVHSNVVSKAWMWIDQHPASTARLAQYKHMSTIEAQCSANVGSCVVPLKAPSIWNMRHGEHNARTVPSWFESTWIITTKRFILSREQAEWGRRGQVTVRISIVTLLAIWSSTIHPLQLQRGG